MTHLDLAEHIRFLDTLEHIGPSNQSMNLKKVPWLELGRQLPWLSFHLFCFPYNQVKKRSFEVRPTFLDTFSNQFPRYSVHSPYAHIGVRWAKKKVVLLQCFSLSFLLPSTFLKHGTFAQFLALFEKQFSTFFRWSFSWIYQDLYDDINAHFLKWHFNAFSTLLGGGHGVWNHKKSLIQHCERSELPLHLAF